MWPGSICFAVTRICPSSHHRSWRGLCWSLLKREHVLSVVRAALIRFALDVAARSTVACDARGWHGEHIEGHVGECKKKHKGTQVFELPPVSVRLPRHSGSLLSWGRERECGLSVAAESSRALLPSVPCPSMKHVAELGTEELQALLRVQIRFPDSLR